jgi:hypothetical protein
MLQHYARCYIQCYVRSKYYRGQPEFADVCVMWATPSPRGEGYLVDLQILEGDRAISLQDVKKTLQGC